MNADERESCQSVFRLIDVTGHGSVKVFFGWFRNGSDQTMIFSKPMPHGLRTRLNTTNACYSTISSMSYLSTSKLVRYTTQLSVNNVCFGCQLSKSRFAPLSPRSSGLQATFHTNTKQSRTAVTQHHLTHNLPYATSKSKSTINQIRLSSASPNYSQSHAQNTKPSTIKDASHTNNGDLVAICDDDGAWRSMVKHLAREATQAEDKMMRRETLEGSHKVVALAMTR
jgi:hypothetical protein